MSQQLETTEEERIGLYKNGWSDAMMQRTPRKDVSIAYQIGYMDALRGKKPQCEKLGGTSNESKD